MFFNKSSSFTVAAASDAALDFALLSNRLAVFDTAAGFASATLSVAVFCCSAAGVALFTASAAVLSAALATADESAEALEFCRLTVFLSVFSAKLSLEVL